MEVYFIYFISIKKIESGSTSGSEVAMELDILLNKMKSKGVGQFLYHETVPQSSQHIYDFFLLYLEKWNIIVFHFGSV
jgi:hypothetical protein